MCAQRKWLPCGGYHGDLPEGWTKQAPGWKVTQPKPGLEAMGPTHGAQTG